MVRLTDKYTVQYDNKVIGYYSVFSDHTVSYYTAYGCPWDIDKELKAFNLDLDQEHVEPIPCLKALINDQYRLKNRKRMIYQDGMLTLIRSPQETDERYSIYRRSAEPTDPDYSPLPHDAPHYEGPHTPKDMREWASWYAFNKMDDGTYQAELDEAWWWGGGHNDGGTIRTEIPEEWFTLPYPEFLKHVVSLSAASHYGFTTEMLLEKEGLKEFFGYE